MKKVLSPTLQHGSPVPSFQTLMTTLQTIVRNTCRMPGAAPDAPTFEIITTPNHTQKRALLLRTTSNRRPNAEPKSALVSLGKLSFVGKQLQPGAGARPGCRQALNC